MYKFFKYAKIHKVHRNTQKLNYMEIREKKLR